LSQAAAEAAACSADPARAPIVLGGLRLEAARFGHRVAGRPTLVFLHEGLGSVALWRDFPPALATATGCAALVYSRQGYGASDPVALPRPLSFMHDEARHVLPALLEAEGIEDAILIGHSDGASIALIYAGENGARLRGLVLEAPHVFVEPVCVESIAKINASYGTSDLRAKLARHHGANVDGAFRGWADSWLDPEFLAWNIEEFLPGVRVPLLVIQGEDDEYGTLAQIERVTRQVSGPVEQLILPRCGHSPHRDQRDKVLAAMTRFIEELVKTTAAPVVARD
jgi:pimeloyl-ACP methyl ester carboxylesterase